MYQNQITGAEKLQQVARLMAELEEDAKSDSLTPAARVQKFLQLRQYGTNPKDADPIYSKDGMRLLLKYGVESDDADVRRAALRCVANALLLEKKMRQIFVDSGYSGKLAEHLESDSSEDELMISRILLFSYDTSIDFATLVNKHGLADNINFQIARHAKQFPEGGKPTLTQTDETGLIDTLKLAFAISKVNPDLAAAFSPSIPDIFKMISRIDIPNQPLDGLLGQLINVLSMLDVEGKKSKVDKNVIFPDINQNGNVDRLINILDRAVSVYKPEELNHKAVPLLYALITIHDLAPEGPRQYMQHRLLPEQDDRSQPIGRSDNLSSRLLKLSTTPYPELKTVISELMFVLSGKDAENLTKNIGYGFAAGFLASRGMEIPRTAGEAFATGSAGFNPDLNPITGQKWSAEPRDQGPPMTQEEKEREAERLFVLFERARANGILSVENPVAQAVREGRFEELPDDYKSDSE